MSERRDLLVEIGTEELPPKALQTLAKAFADGVQTRLVAARLEHGAVQRFATPRRLAVRVTELAVVQPDREEIRRGPALKAAYDADGQPTKAALGFARSCGVSVEDLFTQETDKGAWVAARLQETGQAAAALIPDIVRETLAELPIPKRMRWGEGSEEFVRPVHWAVLLLGTDLIEADILGVRTGRETRGHRFHHPDPIALTDPAQYETVLEQQGRVVADFAVRQARIEQQVNAAAAQLGGTVPMDPALLEEVTALVEWPVAVAGGFEERFLALPPEALISSMKEHQRYFHMVDGEGRLLPHFITISNVESRDPEQVRLGNERVIRPRLSDAEFFWQQDRAQPLAARGKSLDEVVFQQRLGSLGDKAARVADLAAHIAERLDADPALARRAAQLAKCDLLTEMVGEFPDLQGVMGAYYAEQDGEPAEVAAAIRAHYLPRYAGDALPETPVAQALALADRLDTLVGIFAVGQAPKGDRDPFALRRAALGVLRILVEREIDLDVQALLTQAAGGLASRVDTDGVVAQVTRFVLERLRHHALDRGYTADTVEAVLAVTPTRPLDFERRLQAVAAFLKLPEAASLAAANKRIRNILRQADAELPERPAADQLVEEAERDLHHAVAALAEEVATLHEAGRYTDALTRLATLRTPVDRFFDTVMVMTEDAELRRNRLALLRRIEALFLGIADVSRLPSA